MKDINISVRFKMCGVTTICYVLIERKNVPVINEVIDLLTTKLFTSSALTVAVDLEQQLNLEVFCNKDTEFNKAFKCEVKRALFEFHPILKQNKLHFTLKYLRVNAE